MGRNGQFEGYMASEASPPMAAIERWNYEVDTPFRPPHEIAELAGVAAETQAGSKPTLRRGNRGESVRELQQALARAGGQVSADGIFGPATEAAVRAFQSANGLASDGVVGPMTWARLNLDGQAPSGPLSAGGLAVTSGAPSADVPAGPLGKLVLSAANRTFSYQFTQDDLIWTAKLVVHEAGGREDAESTAVLWAMFNHYAFFRHRQYSTFTKFIRAYSTTLQPVLVNWKAAERHYRNPASKFIALGGYYDKAPHIPKGQLQRHLDIQRAPWSSVIAPARRLALRALSGELPNPGIGNANEFASTRVLYYHRHNKTYPTPSQWRQYTEEFARAKKLKWIGDVPGLDQTKNAFFVTSSIANIAPGAVQIARPAGTSLEAEFLQESEYEDFDVERLNDETIGEFESERPWENEPQPRRTQVEIQDETDEDETFYEAYEDPNEFTPEAEELDEATDEATYSEASFGSTDRLAGETPDFGDELPRGSREYVRWVQQSLNQVMRAGLAVDGALGPRTRDAVRRFQTTTGLTVDGIVGPKTENALVAAGAARPPGGPGPSGGAKAPATSPATGQRPRSTQWIRDAWAGHQCVDGRMRRVRILGWNTPVNALTVDAFQALDRALQASGYQAERAWNYVCRKVGGTDRLSLHAYGLAIDIDAAANPHRKGQAGPARFSTAATKQDRHRDVRQGRADTVFTRDQVAAVEGIKTVDGLQIFNWGGSWRQNPDAMHFQINVSPTELARGIVQAA